jgi:hypothetical protein
MEVINPSKRRETISRRRRSWIPLLALSARKQGTMQVIA